MATSTNLRFWSLIFFLLAVITVTEAVPSSKLVDRLASDRRTVNVSQTPTEDFIAWEVVCVYPVSGLYAKSQRVLFYFVSIFVFCVRFHKWLSTAGVGFLMTYTTTAGLHGLILACDRNIGFDLDFAILRWLMGVFSITATNFVFFTPRVVKAQGRFIPLFWLTALIILNLVLNTRAFDFWSHSSGRTAIEVCGLEGDCEHTCGQVSNGTLFRGFGEDLVPYAREILDWRSLNVSSVPTDSWSLAKEISALLPFPQPSENLTPPPRSVFLKTLAQVWGAGLPLQLTMLTLLLPPTAARDAIFKRLSMVKPVNDTAGLRRFIHATGRWLKRLAIFIFFLLWPLQFVYLFLRYILSRWVLLPQLKDVFTSWTPPNAVRNNKLPKSRIMLVKGLATAVYVSDMLSYLIWPALFFYDMIITERLLKEVGFPEQENPRSAGQWATWVNVGLAIVVAVCDRWCRPSLEVNDIWALQGRNRPLGQTRPWWLPNNEAWYWAVEVQETWEELVVWWKDPMAVSWRPVEEDKC